MYKTLIIANTAEAFLPLIGRYANPTEQARRVKAEHLLGDRAIFWRGSDKLVVTSLPAQHASYTSTVLPYRRILNVSPRRPSPTLSLDILTDEDLSARVREAIEHSDGVEIVSYVASDEFVELVKDLRRRGMRFSCPEMPHRAGIVAGRRFDRKSGFRIMCSEWSQECPSLRLPIGRICASKEEAIEAVKYFLGMGKRCVCKADVGESGIGLIWFAPQDGVDVDTLSARLKGEPAFGDDPIVVEEVVAGPGTNGSLSPSVEAQISADGAVRVTYSCLQLCNGEGAFTGVLIGQKEVHGAWLERIEAVAIFIARKLGDLGYVGYFDLDFILDAHGTPYILEGNSRRTGGTHAHEAAEFLVGRDYGTRMTILSRDEVHVKHPLALEKIVELATASLFPINSEPRGVVPTVVAGLEDGCVGYLVIAAGHRDAVALESNFLRSIDGDGPHCGELTRIDR